MDESAAQGAHTWIGVAMDVLQCPCMERERREMLRCNRVGQIVLGRGRTCQQIKHPREQPVHSSHIEEPRFEVITGTSLARQNLFKVQIRGCALGRMNVDRHRELRASKRRACHPRLQLDA